MTVKKLRFKLNKFNIIKESTDEEDYKYFTELMEELWKGDKDNIKKIDVLINVEGPKKEVLIYIEHYNKITNIKTQDLKRHLSEDNIELIGKIEKTYKKVKLLESV